MLVRDRQDAGRRLAALLQPHGCDSPLVLALPRGGVPVACEIACALNAPLDVILVRKLGQPELGVGAIAEGGAVFIDARAVGALAVSSDELARIAERESVELERRARLYRQGRPLSQVAGRTVILVDDGVATGVTIRAAIRALRELRPRKLILAVPGIAADAAEEIRGELDELVCVSAPTQFGAVGLWYRMFPQMSDADVLSLLGRGPAEVHADQPAALEPVRIPCGPGALEGVLGVPGDAWGMVIFALGSGSSRHSRRDQHVARVLRRIGLATLLLDLLTPEEEIEDELTWQLRCKIDLLADRLAVATRWTDADARLHHLPIGYFGASTGAAEALVAAAQFPQRVRAIVSRGGRPDLAGASNLVRVQAATPLIVGGRDPQVLDLTRESMGLLGVERELVVVPGATHLFEEPGALDAVARLAAEWFARHLQPIEAHFWPEGRPP